MISDDSKKILNSISSADIKTFKTLISSNLDIDWNSYEFWQLFVKQTPWNNGHKRFIRFFNEEYNQNGIVVKIEKMSNYDTSMSFLRGEKSLKEAFIYGFQDILRRSFFNTLTVDGFNKDLFDNLLKINPKEIESNLGYLIERVSNENLNLSKHESFLTYIEKKDKKLIKFLFKHIASLQNIEFFKNRYPQEFKDFTEDRESVKDAFNLTKLDKFKFLLKMGHEFPQTKELYSSLFCKTVESSWQFQDYILDKTQDIAWSNQIILKSILHTSMTSMIKRRELLNSVLTRYSIEYPKDCVDLLNKAIHKRDEKHEFIQLIKKHIVYHEMNNKIADTTDEKMELKKKKL